MALNLNDEINHISLSHKESRIRYQCTKCSKIYLSKHGALCHIPKCTGPKVAEGRNAVKCTCGRSFNSRVGLSQHERHEHPLVRNAARAEAAKKPPGNPRSKGFGQVWSKEEIELMHDLEIRLQGERYIANRMCEYLPSRTNRQIRDKRREKTYKEQVSRLLRELDHGGAPGMDQVQGRRSTRSEEGADRSSDEPRQQEAAGDVDSTEATTPQRVPGQGPLPATPEIIITDHSRTITGEEFDWRESFLQNAIEATIPEKGISEETEKVLDLLKQAIIYAREENGQVPQPHIDHIYQQVYQHMKGEDGDTKKRPETGGKKGKAGRHRRR
jgi:hypothetical protein